MKIFSIINRMKQEREESPRSKFGGPSKRVVEVDRLLDLLEDLKVVIPEDIRRASGIISEADNTIRDAKETADEIVEQAHQESDTVLSQAQMEADSIRSNAQAEFESRVCESEVYKEAYERASTVAAEAESNATAIYNGARKYADDILVDLQRYLAEYHQMIDQNRRELGVADDPQPQPAEQVQAPQNRRSMRPAIVSGAAAALSATATAVSGTADLRAGTAALSGTGARRGAASAPADRASAARFARAGVERMPMEDDPAATRSLRGRSG